MRLRQSIHLATLAASLLLAFTARAPAFDDGRYETLQQQRLFSRPPPASHPAAERPHVTLRYAPRRRETPPAMPVPDGIASPDSPGAPPKVNRYVTIFGDSIGVQLGQGLRAAFAANPELIIANKAKVETGLVNTSERDWVHFVHDTLASPEPIDMAIMMIGANDNQPLRDDAGQAQDPLSDKWREIYVKRVDDIVNAVRDKNIPLVWVGMPVMKSEKLTARMLAFNDIYRERVQRAGMTYIDIWEAFSDDAGHYAPNGPDVAGQTVKIRAADGVHFTEAGARKLAFFTEGEVRKLLEQRPVPETPPQVASAPMTAAPPETPAIEQTIINSIAPTLEQLHLQLPEVVPLSVIPVRPLAGPVIPLNVPVLAKGAELANGPPPVLNRDAYSDVLDVLDRGHAPRPKQGRADDFTWTGQQLPR